MLLVEATVLDVPSANFKKQHRAGRQAGGSTAGFFLGDSRGPRGQLAGAGLPLLGSSQGPEGPGFQDVAGMVV